MSKNVIKRIKALRADAQAHIEAGITEKAYIDAGDAVVLGANELGLLHPVNIESYLLVSELAARLGELGLSLKNAENAFSAAEKHLSEDNPLMGDVLRALGMVNLRIGDYEAASEFFLAALSIHENVLSRSAPEVAMDLVALAELYCRSAGRIGVNEVTSALKHAHVIFDKTFGESSTESAAIWRLKGEVLNLGLDNPGSVDYDSVKNAAKTALDIAQKIIDSHKMANANPERLAVYRAKCDFFLKIRDDDNALEMCTQIIQSATNAPEVAKDALRFAVLCAKHGDAEGTISAFKVANSISHWQYRSFAEWSGLADRFQFRDRVGAAEDLCLSLVNSLTLSPEERGSTLVELLLRWRGTTLRLERHYRLALHQAEAGEWAEDARESTRLRGLLASALFRTIQIGDYHQEKVRKILEELRWREKILSLNKTLRPVDVDFEHNLSDIQMVLEAECAAILQFVRINHFDPTIQISNGTARYFLLIVSGRSTTAFDLGDADEIEGFVTDIMYQFIHCDPLSAARQIGLLSSLYARFWDPIAEYLEQAETDTIYIIPDGVIASIPFSALPTPDDKFLVEKFLINYLTSPFDLFKDSEGRGAPIVDGLIFGDPDFGESYASNRLRFRPLSGAQAEIDVVVPLLGKNVLVVQGPAATKRAVREAVTARVLHFTTHGYFFDETTVAVLDKLNQELCEIGYRSILHEIMMIRSGLALAGANVLQSERTDGILTALEVADLDLSATDLVTLSACETGIGVTRMGEGVLGLRYAFQSAGARNVIMSLWNVRGAEVRRQMKLFYGYLKEGVTVDAALQQTQQSQIQWWRRRNAGLAPPAVWGAFIAQSYAGCIES